MNEGEGTKLREKNEVFRHNGIAPLTKVPLGGAQVVFSPHPLASYSPTCGPGEFQAHTYADLLQIADGARLNRSFDWIVCRLYTTSVYPAPRLASHYHRCLVGRRWTSRQPPA